MMRSLASARLLRRGLGAVAGVTGSLWLFAILLWSAQDLLSGGPFPLAYDWLLIETFVIGCALSVVLAGLIARSQSLPRLARLILIALAALAISILHGWIDALLLQKMRTALGSPSGSVKTIFVAGLMTFVLIYGFYAVTIGLMLSSMKVRESERRLAEAQMAAQQAQLTALRFQLNPHFLFNTLNAISSLIVTHQNDLAERMMMQLSEFMRATLETDPNDQVTLAEELSLTQSYLDIEAVRLGDRLDVVMDYPPGLLDALVPNFLLQPLVENSIKYAVAPSRWPVTIAVRVAAEDRFLYLTVVDSGREAFAAVPASGSGVGLQTVRKRLAALYGDDGRIDTLSTPEGFRVTLTLPLTFIAVAQAAE